MKRIPALKAKIGIWDYYVTTLTFRQVSDFVSVVDNQLHKSKGLRELIQRSITDNYVSIKKYILKQPELFFNSLVLAVYNEYPNWREIEFSYEGMETYQMGLLEFPGEHKIFPVDGQHRVEGIKAAVKENPSLENERIAAIFIGHKNTEEGRMKTRRLFTTLNRYAKPVTTDDIIALDEDDSAAIVTRELLEGYDLFSENRIVYAKQKAIPQSNKTAITSIITLYQANVELFKSYYVEKFGKSPTKNVLLEQLKFRPSEEDLAILKQYCINFWDAFKSLNIVKGFLAPHPQFESFRNSTDGGNLIFRPIGFLPLVKAAVRVKRQTGNRYERIFAEYTKMDFNLKSRPWVYVLWNPLEKKMIMNTTTLAELLLLYLYDKQLLDSKELKKLKNGYASCLSIDDPKKIARILDGLTE